MYAYLEEREKNFYESSYITRHDIYAAIIDIVPFLYQQKMNSILLPLKRDKDNNLTT